MSNYKEFQVNKNDLSKTRIRELTTSPLQAGEVRAKIDRFAFTANNVTYGVVGERIGYWKFFPVMDEGWGVIPVWGFAEIVESKNDEVPVGERLYGYWPMAEYLTMAPSKVSEMRLLDGIAHRAELPPVYNSYARVIAEAQYDPSMDDERMVLFPLYATSFCLYDFFLDNDWFGAEQIFIPSASSKTAIGVAYAFASNDRAPELIGLTSTRNKSAVEALGLYDGLWTYDEIAKTNTRIPSAIIDMSGNGAVLGALHRALGDNMKYTSNVGLTHSDANEMGDDFIRERSAMFFAPGHIQKRAADWGPGEFEKRAGAFWYEATLKSRSWLNINSQQGSEAMIRIYNDVFEGKSSPDQAWVAGF